jgi:hypothetical protein
MSCRALAGLSNRLVGPRGFSSFVGGGIRVVIPASRSG